MDNLKKIYYAVSYIDKKSIKMRIIKELEISNATFYRYLSGKIELKKIEVEKINQIINTK